MDAAWWAVAVVRGGVEKCGEWTVDGGVDEREVNFCTSGILRT